MCAKSNALRKISFHLIRNINSPDESVAPIILSGSKPLPKPRGFSSSPPFFFLEDPPSASDLLLSAPFFLSALSLRAFSKASIMSSQSKFSLGSQVLSSSPYPFHFKRYSTLPFLPTRLSTTLSTTYSSSSPDDMLNFLSVKSFENLGTMKKFDEVKP